MKPAKHVWTGIAAAIGLLVLILDNRTALTGSVEGIKLCLSTVIPSLFPFIVISGILNKSLIGKQFRILQPICRMCGIPPGAASLLLLGFLGGYPVGAQSINEACACGSLSKEDGNRMLGFCNNAGPAFIFGMLGNLYDAKLVSWILWAIHILSALIVGFLLPNKAVRSGAKIKSDSISMPQAVEKSLRTTGVICGWVVLFRVISAFLQRWLLWLFPKEIQIGIIGFLELSNGCCALFDLPSQGMRFIFSAFLLGIGGICVAMQTVSVTKALDMQMYFPGKVLQSIVSLLLAGIAQNILFPAGERIRISFAVYLTLTILCGFLLFILKRQNNSRNPAPVHV